MRRPSIRTPPAPGAIVRAWVQDGPDPGWHVCIVTDVGRRRIGLLILGRLQRLEVSADRAGELVAIAPAKLSPRRSLRRRIADQARAYRRYKIRYSGRQVARALDLLAP